MSPEIGPAAATGGRIGSRPWHARVALLVIFLLVAWFAERAVAAVMQDRRKDFYEFFCAAEAMVRGQDPYAVGGTGYIYPPILAALLVPLVPLGISVATIVWAVLLIAVMSLSTWLAARETLERFRRRAEGPLVAVVTAAALVIAGDKMRSEIVMGQSNLLMVLAWVLGLVWLDRRPLLAGLALGFGINIKYLTLLAVPYLLVRGRFKAAAATVGSAVMWALLPAVYVGWSTNLGYLHKAFGGLVGMVESKDTAEVFTHVDQAARIAVLKEGFSMSITSWAARMTADVGVNARTIALLGTVGLCVLGAVWAVYRAKRMSLFSGRWGRSEQRGSARAMTAMEWSGLVVASLAFGPQTNSRHLTMLLLPIVMAVGIVLAPALRARRWPLVLGLVVLWAGITLPFGSDSARDAIDQWRVYAGPSWCMILMLLTLLWVGLEDARESIKAPA